MSVALAALALALSPGFSVELAGVPPTAQGLVRVEAVVAGAEVERVELVVDGWLRATETRAPFTFEWDTHRELDGAHRLELWAVARDGRVATAARAVRVSNPFELALSGLGPGATVSGRVRLRAFVHGQEPQWVELAVDGELRATDDERPFGTSWDTTAEADGRHRVSLWAVAPNGRVATRTIAVIVRNGHASGLTPATAAAARRLREEALRWESLTRTRRPARPAAAGAGYWRERAREARERASRPPHWREFLCIHRYEGAWNANTGNGYFGGLQMNMDFMRAYGPELLARKGTADRWTPLEQIWVAERAVPGRGFRPWPQTARRCGLL